MGVLLLGTGGGVCWSAVLNIAEIVFKSNAIPVEEAQAAQQIIHLMYSNPVDAIWKLKNEEVLSTAGISVTAFSIITKEALFRYTLYVFAISLPDVHEYLVAEPGNWRNQMP